MDSTLSRNLQPQMGVAVDGAYSKHHTVNPPDDKEPISFIFILVSKLDICYINSFSWKCMCRKLLATLSHTPTTVDEEADGTNGRRLPPHQSIV